MAGKTVLCAFVTADQREKKTSVKSENADGIPKFLRYEKICGRLPSSPPTESASVTWRFLQSAVPLHIRNGSGYDAPMFSRYSVFKDFWRA